MPRPTVRDVHLNAALTQIAIAYRNPEYIFSQVFPIVRVQKQSDYYYVFDAGAWFRDEVKVRAPGTRAARADYAISSASYVCKTYAIAKGVPDEVRENADAPLKPDVEATQFVTDQLLRAQERRVAALVTGSANWAYAATPSTKWSASDSDPIGDVEAAKDAVVQAIGRVPNTMVISYQVWRYVRNHPDLLDRLKYTNPTGVITPEQARTLFGVDRLLIGTALYDSAKEGESSSRSFIWGDTAWVGWVPRNAALMEPAAGYVLEWMTRQVRTYREEQEHQDVVEAQHSVAEVITASDAGGVVYDVL